MIYDLLAPFYDNFNSDINYSLWADFIEKIFEKHSKIGKPDLVLDLGCGTGSVCGIMADRGYDMIGIDASEEMLSPRTSTFLFSYVAPLLEFVIKSFA